ncbi:MAG: hypothetical protein H5T34_01620 [Candidatus Methanomethyliales bacterium]|nr:hypothetical protein [Candidatus Methanomethylicales archaeon]
MRKALVVLLILAVAAPVAYAAALSPWAMLDRLGSITPVIQTHEAVDLGTYTYEQTLPPPNSSKPNIFLPLPQNVSMASIRADVSKTLSPPSPAGTDSLTVGLWVADEKGKIIALLIASIREVEYANKGQIFVDPWRNTPSITCTSTRLYPQIKDQIKNGGYVSVTFTPEDFEPGLELLGKSAGGLTAVGICPYSLTHLYTVPCTTISVKCTGIYSMTKMMVESAEINGVKYEANGGAIILDGPVSGEVKLNLYGRLIFIPLYRTVTLHL